MSGQQLFISHSSEDAAVADRIVAYLEARGVPCWISSRDIPPSAVYAELIALALRECNACVVIASHAANRSDAVKRELELASRYRKPFIPVRIDDTRQTAGFEYYLQNVQWVDYARGGEGALSRIVAARGTQPPSAPGALQTATAHTNSSSVVGTWAEIAGDGLMIFLADGTWTDNAPGYNKAQIAKTFPIYRWTQAGNVVEWGDFLLKHRGAIEGARMNVTTHMGERISSSRWTRKT